ncbi:hypothetical protein QJS10_CPB14g01165 [Acorus calamus]|uniref:Non-haem dioxygenase N-terminal domain-containing protein n=1 Tax=Acorus calamus TaxID=4465 RepID=A0AAV9DDE5_ACOCL|nr:hypothetical protein QJS10_CPB14g01165 [Acorus calamus]
MDFPLTRPPLRSPTARLPSSPPAHLHRPPPPVRVSCRGGAGTGDDAAVRTVRTVTISHSELKDKGRDLSAKIEEGFGPNGLGILSVSDIPGYISLRRDLLHLSPRLANLPEELMKELEDPESRYNFGWSHGKEKLESGKLDTLKGSFYANPIFDVPTSDVSLMQRYPSYCRPNIWPNDALPKLEQAFKMLGKLMLDVGLMLAYHCDRYVFKKMAKSDDEGLESILLRSRCHKGRLLYYFPRQQRLHSCLMHQVVFQENEIAYQIGETTEILSSGLLCATPHCVQAPKGEKALGVERSTFALFMQPDWNENLAFPKDIHLHHEFVPPNGTLTFGEYSEMLLNKYYHMRP